METVISAPKKMALKYQMQDIALDITWSKIASRYFGKSPSWMYHKLNGIDGNGNPTEFNPEELLLFKNALFDFSERVRNVAYSL
jgi:hypothetical protein